MPIFLNKEKKNKNDTKTKILGEEMYLPILHRIKVREKDILVYPSRGTTPYYPDVFTRDYVNIRAFKMIADTV